MFLSCKYQCAGSEACGVLVLDFDRTLSVKHVCIFDIEDATTRAFGGVSRVETLQRTLQHVRSCGVLVTVVTRNARHIIQKALGRRPGVGLMDYVADGMVFGFEDYPDEMPKSQVITEHILQPRQLSAADLLFVDDDAQNVEDVLHACPGAQVIRSPRDGIGVNECDTICQWANRMAK